MSTTSDFSYAVGYAYDWNEKPEWNIPSLKSPIPCRAGINCSYAGVCSFVHPGEEGVKRYISYARYENQQDMVRLYNPTHERGLADYYVRRYERKSWPEWCALKGLSVPVQQKPVEKPTAVVLGGAAHSGKRKQVIDLSKISTIVQDAVNAAGGFTTHIYTLPSPQIVQLVPVPVPVLTAEQVMLMLGDKIWIQVNDILQDPISIAALQQAGLYTPSCSPNKIVGMLLTGFTMTELEEVNNSRVDLIEAVIDCCEVLAEDEKRKRQQNVFQKMNTIGWGDMLNEIDCA